MNQSNFIPISQEEPSRRSSGMKNWPVLTLLGVLIIFGVGFVLKDKLPFLNANLSSPIEIKGYQAIFLTSGQVYFGNLEIDGSWIVLRDVYYLQADPSSQLSGTQQPQGTNQIPSNFQLVKLGSEIHGPEDVMHIDSDKIIFWENMKPDSQVVQAIEKYKEGKK